VVSSKDFGYTSVRYAQLTADVTRPDADAGQFDNAYSNRVRQRPSVDEHATKLVYLAVLLLLLLLLLLEALLVLL